MEIKKFNVRFKRGKGALTYYVIKGGGSRESLKCLFMIMAEGEGNWPYDGISKYVFLQSEVVLKQKTVSNYLQYIFVITIASIHFHGFPVHPSHNRCWHDTRRGDGLLNNDAWLQRGEREVKNLTKSDCVICERSQIQAKFYIYEILMKIQAKEEILNFLKT